MEKWITNSEELTELWALSFDEMAFLAEKHEKARLDFALRIRYYSVFGKFPRRGEQIPSNILNYIADQIDSPDAILPALEKRVVQRRNAEVRAFVAFSPLNEAKSAELLEWFNSQADFITQSSDEVEISIRNWCLNKQYESPSYREIERLIDSVQSKYELAEFGRIKALIDDEACARLTNSIAAYPAVPSLLDIRADPGRIGRDNFNFICQKLKFISDLHLPSPYILTLNADWRKGICRKIARYKPAELQRMSKDKQIGMYAVYLISRLPEITDALVEMLIDSVHKIQTKAIRTIEKQIAKDIHNVYDKEKLLTDILIASLENPDYPVSEVIFPIISPKEAEALIEKQKGRREWAIDIFSVMHGSWQSHYRTMLKNLLETVEFCSNVQRYRPIVEALDWISINFDRRSKIIFGHEDIPIEGVIPDEYRPAVIRRDGSIDKYSYELCAIIALREKLRCREVWVQNSEKFKNPDEDIPHDFEERRAEYYDDLNLDLDVQGYVEQIKEELEAQLLAFDSEFPKNKYVGINNQKSIPTFWLSPLLPQQEPVGLTHIKAEIANRWPMTGLIDMLKEAALDTQFTKAFQSIGAHRHIDNATLNRRLILSMYGLGTNTGLKRISAATPDVSYEQLRHIRRRFIDVPSLREANRVLTNSILGIRDSAIWGEMGTATASDSKQFKVWDHNPMAEYHVRYGGRGVMVYWHVERRSTCIYSQLKKVSSHEAASMIEGVLHHCSEMSIDRHYVDTHGQTEVAFAFSRLLGFDLAPRIKRISHVKLFSPYASFKSKLSNVGRLMVRPIDWKLIARYFDEMVKYATAMKTGTTSPEIILRRFARSNNLHPTYKALAELGRAIKTIFVCRYLRFEEFRREIQEGLNVMENWNSATNFVYFGRGGEITSNRKEDQEIAVQSLHLLQNCMVYVNTQMYQSILSEPQWKDRMSPEDFRGITPLIYNHVNPYGRFDVNLDRRIKI